MKAENVALITEDWLKEVGFKWHQLDRQPEKQWLLWIGEVVEGCYEDLGVELAPNRSRGEVKDWFCWFRSDSAGRYHRFIHLRHLKTQEELVALIEGLTGQKWDVGNNIYGWMRTPERAAQMRAESERLDLKLRREGASWFESEKDESRGGPLVDHVNYAIDHLEKLRNETH